LHIVVVLADDARSLRHTGGASDCRLQPN